MEINTLTVSELRKGLLKKDFTPKEILDSTIKKIEILDPKLNAFHNCWKENSGTIIHATSIPYTQRSHFEGQNLMESGGRIAYQEKTGWVGRAMKLAKLQGEGLALSLPMPLFLSYATIIL